MSHVIAWLILAVACIACHAGGILQHETAAFVMIVSIVALAAHFGLTQLYTITSVDAGEMPHPELHSAFLTAHFKACQSSQPDDWFKAAMAAKRWETAMGKPAHHIHHSLPNERAA